MNAVATAICIWVDYDFYLRRSLQVYGHFEFFIIYIIIYTLTIGFRAKLGDLWSLYNHVQGQTNYII